MGNQAGRSIAFVGAGPRTTGILERLAARVDQSTPALTIHLIDPFAPGSGRIWRREQSALLRLNSMAADISMFTDSSVLMEGPAVRGPSLYEWAQSVRDGGIDLRQLNQLSRLDRLSKLGQPSTLGDKDHVADSGSEIEPAVTQEIDCLAPESFPSRILHSYYLKWCLQRVLQSFPPEVTVRFHADRVKSLAVLPSGKHQLRLMGTSHPLSVDAVVLALGHTDRPAQPSAFSDFARRHGAVYQPPSYTVDTDFSWLQPGQSAIVRGMGLAFVDLCVVLMEGRGGRFVEHDGELRYLPSGQEPVLHVGSRRGVPYVSKPRPILHGTPATLRYLNQSGIKSMLAEHSQLDFDKHLYPLIERELKHGYYRELGTGHPHRLRVPWPDLQAAIDQDATDQEILDLLKDPQDLLDLKALDQPLESSAASDLQDSIRRHVERILTTRTSEENSETFGLFLALIGCHQALSTIPAEKFSATALKTLKGSWHSKFSYLASGPPPARLRELLALHQAGLVRFLGPGLKVRTQEVGTKEATGRFIASSTAHGSQDFAAGALIDAFLPSDPCKFPVDAHSRAIRADGSIIPGRFAVGPFTSAVPTAAFSRPHTNAPGFRENDALAQRLFEEILSPAPADVDTHRSGLGTLNGYNASKTGSGWELPSRPPANAGRPA